MRLSKKGATDTIVLPEFLRIILAIISILILIYLLYSLYGFASSKTKLEQARVSIDELAKKINSLDATRTDSYVFVAPSDWYFSNSQTEKTIPQCLSQNCICLCDSGGCDGLVACKPVNFFVYIKYPGDQFYESVRFDPPANLRVTRTDREIFLFLEGDEWLT